MVVEDLVEVDGGDLVALVDEEVAETALAHLDFGGTEDSLDIGEREDELLAADAREETVDDGER